MDQPEDTVSDLQHSLINAHGLLKKMKAISRQLNASHTLLLMKQSTSNDELSEYVHTLKKKLDDFHEEMVHQLNKSFQEKTAYLNSCLMQLQWEEKTIDKLCKETESMLKMVTRTISPMQLQRARTLLEAFRMISKENSAVLELKEDVLCLDFVVNKSIDEFSQFGSIRVSRDSPTQNACHTEKSGNKMTASRSCQTEVLFKDYCPFCGRTYSKGKKDMEIQTEEESNTSSEAEKFWVEGSKGKELFVGGDVKIVEKCKMCLQNEKNGTGISTIGDSAISNMRLIRHALDHAGLGKKPTSDDSSSSFPEEIGQISGRKNDQGLQPRKRSTLAGKKLKDLSKQFDEVWHSSDEEMEEVTAKLSNDLTFSAAVKHNTTSKGDKSNQSKKKSEISTVTSSGVLKENFDDEPSVENPCQTYVPPPPGFIKTEPVNTIDQPKPQTKAKKRMLAAESLSMLTGLMKTAKAENIIKPPHVSMKKEPEQVPEKNDWWGESPCPRRTAVTSPAKPKTSLESISEGSGGSSSSVPECWLDNSDAASNSITSTPIRQTKEVAESLDEDDTIKLRRPSLSFKTSPFQIKNELDSNNNNSVVTPSPVKSPTSVSLHEASKSKADVDSSGVTDSGWEEDSGMSESKDSLNGHGGLKETPQKKIPSPKYSDSWTKNASFKPSSTPPKSTTQPKTDQVTSGKKTLFGSDENQNNQFTTDLNMCELGISKLQGKIISDTTVKKQETAGEVWKLESEPVASKTTTISVKTTAENWETAQASNDTKTRGLRWDQVPSTMVFSKPPNQCENVDKVSVVKESKWDKLPPNAEPNETRQKEIKRWDQPPPTLALKPTMSPVAKYIEQMSEGQLRILSPLPAKLTGKIGGKDSSSGLHFPIGVATTSGGDIIVADTGNNLLKIFNPEGKLIQTIGERLKPQMQRPSAIVVNAKDDVFVKDDKCIRMFDIIQGVAIRQMGIKQLSLPYGLALTSDGNLLTLDVDKRNPRIVIFSQKGDLVNSFPYTPLQGHVPQSKCRFLDVNQNTLVVSDLGRHQVYVTDLQGRMTNMFGIGGYGNGEFYEPSGVVVDSSGNMIIADSKNDRVQIFRPDGSFLCIVGFSEPIKRPSDIHLTKDGKLLVVNYLHKQIKIYKLGEK